MLTTLQQQILNAKRSALGLWTTNTQVMSGTPGTDARPFVVPTLAPVNYPAVGAAAVNIISYNVPPGMRAMIKKISINHIGGNPPDGTGGVIWRLKVNGAGVKGMENLQYQLGGPATPVDVQLMLEEQDQFVITVETVIAQVPNSTTAAIIYGYAVPASQVDSGPSPAAAPAAPARPQYSWWV